MTRREGTSKSNSVDARGDFASKLDVAQIYFSHRKIDTALDPTNRFCRKQVKPIQLVMANPLVTTRSARKFVFEKIVRGQGPAWRSSFQHGFGNLCFLWNCEVVRFPGYHHRRERLIARRTRHVSCNFVD